MVRDDEVSRWVIFLRQLNKFFPHCSNLEVRIRINAAHLASSLEQSLFCVDLAGEGSAPFLFLTQALILFNIMIMVNLDLVLVAVFIFVTILPAWVATITSAAHQPGPIVASALVAVGLSVVSDADSESGTGATMVVEFPRVG